MNFDQETIKQQIVKLLSQKWQDLIFYLGAKCIHPQSVTIKDGIQLTEGDFIDDYNFNCKFLHLRIQVENTEISYEGDCTLKVTYKNENSDSKPVEYIESIKDNRIQIKKK